MTKVTILGHVFETDDRWWLFLERYKERILTYAASHNVKEEVIDDILYSIIEKLYTYEAPITEDNVIAIANIVGEPETIFILDWSESDEIVTKKQFFLQKKKPLIRWVCYRLSNLIKIDVMIIRIIFLILLIGGWSAIIPYVILALFVPYDKKATTWSVWKVVFEWVRIVVWSLIAIFLWTILGWWLLALVWVYVMSSYMFAPFLAWVPQYLPLIWVAWIVGVAILFVASLSALFKKKWIHTSLVISSFILVFVSLLMTGGIIGRRVADGFHNMKTVDYTNVLTWAVSGSTLTIDVTSLMTEEEINMDWKELTQERHDRIIAYTNNTVPTMTTRISFTAPTQALLDQYSNEIQPLSSVFMNDVITLKYSGENNQALAITDKPFPFSTVKTTIYVPRQYTRVVLKSTTSERLQINTESWERSNRCREWIAVYSTWTSWLVCESDLNQTSQHSDSYYDEYDQVKEELMDIKDEISY